MNHSSGVRTRLAICNDDDHDDTRVVPWDQLMRWLTRDEHDLGASEAIQLARLRAVRELYAVGDALGALTVAALLESDLREVEDDVTVEVVGEDEVELIMAAPAVDDSIRPSRIVMVVPG